MVVTAETKPIRLYTPAKGIAKDAYGRTMSYLRISLTDRCNFRCVYCMPEMGMKFQPRDEILTDEELIRVVGAFAGLGFTKFRLTGGEPTIRPHLVDIVRAIKSFPGVEEVTMTTNALLLGRMADGSGRCGTGPYQCQSRYAQSGALQGNDPGRPIRHGLGWHPRR